MNSKIRPYQEKPTFDNVSTEQIVYGIQTNEAEITRLMLLERRLTDAEDKKLETLHETIAEARKELVKRAAENAQQKRLF